MYTYRTIIQTKVRFVIQNIIFVQKTQHWTQSGDLRNPKSNDPDTKMMLSSSLYPESHCSIRCINVLVHWLYCITLI